MKKKNILLISHDLNVCGAPNSLLRQAKYFKQAGHDVTVWTLADGPLRPRYEEAGFSPVVVNNSYDAIVDAYDKTQKNFDFILCNTIVTYKFVRFFKNITKNLVWFIRETKLVDDWIRENPEFAKEYTSFQNIYTVSEYAATVSKKYNDNIHWFPNAIADNFHEFHKSKSGVTFGYIGSVIQVKGIDLLVNAFLEINKENPDTRLIIAGCEGLPLEQELKKLTKNNKNVVWMGQVQGAEKENFFNSIDVLCVPSLDEPFSLSLLEGAMYGKVIITTENTGAKYIVKDNESGFIIKTGDEQDLLNAMRKLLNANISYMQKKSREQYIKKGTQKREKKNVLKMLKNNLYNKNKKLFYKNISKNGRVRIYFCGIKIASYSKKCKKIDNNYQIVSLGFNCLPRTTLTLWGVKPTKEQGELSYPFDLAVHSLPGVINLLKADFKNYFTDVVWNETRGFYTKKDDSIRFNHDTDLKSIDELKERFKHRVENFRNLRKSKKHLIFVIAMNFSQYEPPLDEYEVIPETRIKKSEQMQQDLHLLKQELKKYFKNKKISLLVIDTLLELKPSPDYVLIQSRIPSKDYALNWWKYEYITTPEGKAFEGKIVDEVKQYIAKL